MPHSSSEGVPDPFFPPPLPFSPLSGGICCFIRACSSHQSADFILQMRSEAGQLPGLCRKERPQSYQLPCGLFAPVSLFLSFSFPPLWLFMSTETREVSGLFARTPSHLRGGEISFTSPPVIWTVTNEASLLTSTDEQPRAGLGSLSGANDTSSGSVNRAHACFYYRYPCM